MRIGWKTFRRLGGTRRLSALLYFAVRPATWTQSVPPAVAGGYVVDALDLLRFRCACTHLLPQVVLTVSKWRSILGDPTYRFARNYPLLLLKEYLNMSKLKLIILTMLLQLHFGAVYLHAQTEPITRQEMLRGSVTPEREWWDVLHYHLQVEFLPETRRLKGSNTITFKTLKPGNKMQIDLQPPLAITRVMHGDEQLKFDREGNVYWVMFAKELPNGVEDKIEISYEGVPVVSKNPPWVGRITWGRDDLGHHFIVTTCQGIGASIWWPNKDHGADEPDRGMQISVTVPENLVAVSNGRLKKTDHDVAAKKKTYHWEVVNPINNYGVNVNIGNYINLTDKYHGLGGDLDINYWVLPHQKEAALRQFKEVKRMLEAFEYWFGKYPFYEDGYKLVTVSYPGMEHQSSVTYGNFFRNGYMARDPCACGVGFKFDFIIVHESAHEWFGNNISMKDP